MKFNIRNWHLKCLKTNIYKGKNAALKYLYLRVTLLEKANHSTIGKLVDKALFSLWPSGKEHNTFNHERPLGAVRQK